jgi:hypothetical protein
MKFLIKKYNTKAFGAENIGYVAYDTLGNPVAYYGIFPCRAAADSAGKTILIAQSGDTMTHPKHRGKGLFVKLAEKTYSLARQHGIKFIYGFPNKNSTHGLVKSLGWTHEENLNIYRIKIITFPLAYICNKISVLNGFYRWYSDLIIKNMLSKRKYFENPLLAEGYYGVERNGEFFDYKTYMHKHIAVVNGKCVYLKTAPALRIGDVETCSETEFNIIVNKLKTLARLLGNYAVIFYYSPGVKYDGYLKKRYNAIKGLAVCWIDFESGLDLSRFKVAQADLDTY